MNEFFAQLLLIAPPLLLALTIHEFAHGLVAFRFGDPTARNAGRLTMNPLKHLDPLGTLAFFFIKFGWAKPVPVNPAYFHNPKKAMLWVALAGPASNFLLALAFALLAKAVGLLLMFLPYSPLAEAVLLPLNAMLVAGVWINLVLCIINLLPIPPLDGGRIVTGLLPDPLAATFLRLERYGFVILLVLALSGMLGKLVLPIIRFAHSLLLS
jgi:Zn-dependent protease